MRARRAVRSPRAAVVVVAMSVALASVACRRASHASADAASAIAASADAAHGASASAPPLAPLTRALFELGLEARGGDPVAGEGAARDDEATLRALGAAARAALVGAPATTRAAALDRVVFDVGAFAREVEDPDLSFVLLPSVVAARRGSCVGLGTLYLAVAELAGVPARAVLVPGHFYVQVDEGARWRNVELLRRGEEMPASWYDARYPIPRARAATYGRPLTPDEVLAVVAYDVGNQRRRQNRLPEARRFFSRAVGLFPDFAEAHASLGATLHLLGQLDEADAAYRAARRLAPALPGLDRNIDLLETERRAKR
jgi:tetratricopeptide (TPR) repeat protein